MSTAGGTRRGPRRQLQDGSADKVVVNLEASSPAVGSRRGGPTAAAAAAAAAAPAPAPAGCRTSPIDVEAIEDEVQAVSPSRVPPLPPRRNRRTRREHVAVVDLEVDAGQEVNKRQRVAHIVHCLSPRGESSSLQSNNAARTSKEPEAPKEAIFTCPVCWNKLEEASTTICGHIFCSGCIKQAIKVQKKCPTCRRSLKANNFHRIYLPNAGS